MIKFSEMPYKRPDLDGLRGEYAALTERLKAVRSYGETKAAFLDMEALEKRVGTQSNWPTSAAPSTPGTHFTTGR